MASAIRVRLLQLLTVLAAAVVVSSSSTFSPLRPPAIPLAVRSPYLSTWLSGDAEGILPGSWPSFWATQTTGWQGFIRVDNVTYTWMGRARGLRLVNQTSFAYTSTQSIFTFDVAGKVSLIATFLSPVYPDDLLRQSLQFSYVHLAVQSTDGAGHHVQLYSDVSGEWVASDIGQHITWDAHVANGLAYHHFALTNPANLKESEDMARWGDWFFGIGATNGTTLRAGFPDVETRAQFVRDGQLDGQESTRFRAIRDTWPVFAVAQDLGTVFQQQNEALLAIGLTQDDVVLFQGNSTQPEALTGLWKTAYSSPSDAFVGFYRDWSRQRHDAGVLDAKIHDDSFRAGGQNYASLTTLVVRQVFGGLQVAHGVRQDYVFLKEISSDGDTQTVDVIFPAHPIFLYLNPGLLKLLLDPLFENQESGHYPNPWSVHDLGFFPNATGFPNGNDEAMPVEECGNMIIMTLAYAVRSGNSQYLTQHWPLLNQWAQFLVNDSLIPDYQLSTDDFAGALANQTNLALKGIIGVRAMSEIALLGGLTDGGNASSQAFLETAQAYMTEWQGYGINANATPPHTTLAYNESDTHGLLYNIYADRLLGLKLVPDAVYEMQSNFYAYIMEDFGVPLDTRHDWAKSDWQMFAAAVAAPDVKRLMIERLVRFVNETTSAQPLTDLYNAATGNFPLYGPMFANRPVVGAFFALLALPT